MTQQSETESVKRQDVWALPDVAANYLDRSRQAIPLADEQLDVMLRLLAAHDVTVRQLLDLGAGDGHAAAVVMANHPVENAVLVDYTEFMLTRAQERFADASANVTAVLGDLNQRDWYGEVERQDGYDAVISRYAIHHLPDERKYSLYRDILGFLRPGGLFINIEHVKSASPLYQQAFDTLMIEGIAATTDSPTSFQEAADGYHQRWDAETNILAPVELQLDWLREFGYEDVDCACKIFELAVFVGKRPDV